MSGMHAPPIVDENVENRKENHKEGGGPFGLETYSYHTACCQAEDRDKYTRD